jgi:hypothetical protein
LYFRTPGHCINFEDTHQESFWSLSDFGAHLKRVRYSISRFVEYLIEKGLFDPLLEREIHQPLLDDYLAWMAHHQYAAA